MQAGRIEIYTDVEEITSQNIISVLQDALAKHLLNSARCTYLLNFDAGVQPQVREKKTRTDIDIHCVDNVAHEAVAFNEAYHWGNPITFIQRGEKDSGSFNETDAISLLNEQYSAQNVESKTQENGRYIEICGVSYVFVDVNVSDDWEEGESYFTYDVLDPRKAFVVKSSKLGHKKMLGVTYSEDALGTRHFTCFTKDRRYEIVASKIVNDDKPKEKDAPDYAWSNKQRSGEKNPLGLIPIIECIRSYDRMGCFEREIDDMLTLNLIESDIANACDEDVQKIWHSNDVEFPIDENGKQITPKNNDWLQTYTTANGKTPFVTPLSISFDYVGNLNYANSKRTYILEKLCIPQRSSATNGATGVAMDSATGWNSAENLANAIENIAIGWKMEELKVVLRAIQIHPNIPSDSPLLKLKAMDVKPSIKRNKNYELSVKSNFIATLLKCGIYGKHIIDTSNAFSDPNQVWEDSKDMIMAMQKSLIKEDTSNDEVKPASDDVVNQVENSPILDKNRG